ncbi:EC35 protein [Colletotrichum higginsianum IMI 349063]|uniref:EC35 protein n=2 Tax=Colletotrichum higginsianum TaxID=80884 RepID=A0A1B7Y0Z8_COLHI|nr:EC35 protein [Colletotrichum higginsianum IMI 349063]OBR05687.1 EC35 protein [Colletotrichum higginsianum IMI 349063]TIC90467.1 Heat-labile enterotoxin IIA, A chain [Colletotrichum higginsianum]
MHTSSFILFFGLLASVVSAVTLYRGDSRGPKQIKEAGGFKSRADHDHAEGTLFEHVTKQLKHPMKNRYIPTTVDINEAKKQGGSKYLYHLNSDEIEEQIWDVAAEYEKAGKTYPYASEQEFAVEYHIPWEAITKVERNVDGQWKTIKLSKRGVELFEENVFVD